MNVDPGVVVGFLMLALVLIAVGIYYNRLNRKKPLKGGEHKHKMPPQSGPDRKDAYE